MAEIDMALRRLAEDSAPSRLETVEASVLAAVSGHEFSHRGPAMHHRVAAVALALFMGIAGGMLGDQSASAGAVAPFGAAAELAPSTLLTEGW